MPSNYTYSDYKKYSQTAKCAKTYKKRGCLSQYGASGGRLMVYWRNDIRWKHKDFPDFTTALVCACAQAAKDANVKYFGIKYWGECWQLPINEVSHHLEPGKCVRADGSSNKDGTYKKGCPVDADYECNADGSHFYKYENIDFVEQ